MTTADDSERNLLFEKRIRSLLLKHLVDFNCAEGPRDGVYYSHWSDTALVVAALKTFHQLIFPLLQDEAERTRHLITLKDDNSFILTLILSWIKRTP